MRSPLHLILLFGVVSLFGDITYEGAHSIIGPYFSQLGATVFAVGIVTGVAEFSNFSFRIVSGWISDRTRRFWFMTFLGYVINLGAVPLLALATHWQWAALLYIAERFGKAVRSPPRDAMLSYAAKQTGRGWGFGIHEALDQIGAVVGPLFVWYVMKHNHSVRFSFALLAIPAALAIAVLTLARIRFSHPQDWETATERPLEEKKFPCPFWFYIAATSFVALGFVQFPLIALQISHQLTLTTIPLLFALAMGIQGLFALILGWLFDRFGLWVVMGATFISSAFAPFVFLAGASGILAGMILWGIGMGSQDAIFRAAVATWIAPGTRATAYGILNLSLGLFWFFGNVTIGYLLGFSPLAASVFSVCAQLLSLPLFWWAKNLS